MGDEKYYTIQVKGTAYRWQPIPASDVEMLATVVNMGASTLKSYKALLRILAASAGPEQWDVISDRLIERELSTEDFSGVFKRLIERQRKDTGPDPTGGGLDVASTTLQPADGE